MSEIREYECENCDTTMVVCKGCEKAYEKTKENFYTAKGKLKTTYCKKCKRQKSRENEKNRPPRKRKDTRDRTAYNPRRRELYKLKKEREKSETMTFTTEEHEYIREYVRVSHGVKDVSTRKMKKVWRDIYFKVRELIERYGEDGMGDKPIDMNRVVYWLSHLE